MPQTLDSGLTLQVDRLAIFAAKRGRSRHDKFDRRPEGGKATEAGC